MTEGLKYWDVAPFPFALLSLCLCLHLSNPSFMQISTVNLRLAVGIATYRFWMEVASGLDFSMRILSAQRPRMFCELTYYIFGSYDSSN